MTHHLLARFRNHAAARAAAVDEIEQARQQRTYASKAPNDADSLRGIPTVARGVSGVQPGLHPEHAALAAVEHGRPAQPEQRSTHIPIRLDKPSEPRYTTSRRPCRADDSLA